MPRRFGAPVLLFAATLAGAIAVTSTAWSDNQSGDKGTKELTRDAARKLKSPVPYSKASIARGKLFYLRVCTECHGADGKSQVDVIANATDLTNPKAWASGTTEGEVYRSIKNGAGDAMPPFADRVSNEQELWDLVNYVRSLWPDSARPKLEQNTASTPSH